MATKVKKRKYSGLLAKPVRPYSAPGGMVQFLSPEEATELNRAQYEARFDALFDFYAIDRSSPAKYEILAMMLAVHHVRGFKIVKAKKRVQGRPRRAAKESYGLVERINAMKKAGITIVAACEKLSKEKFGNPPRRLKASSIRSYYNRSR